MDEGIRILDDEVRRWRREEAIVHAVAYGLRLLLEGVAIGLAFYLASQIIHTAWMAS